MRSRKKAKNKSRILIVTSKSIASAMSCELAMLFRHAGCDVFFALPDASGEWVSTTPIKEITGHRPYSEIPPGWCRSKHPFDLTVMLDPSFESLEKLLQQQELNEIYTFIKKKTRLFAVISSQKSDKFDYQKFLFNNFRFFHFSELNLKPGKVFQKFFSNALRMLAGVNSLNNAKCNIINDATIENETIQKHLNLFYNLLSHNGFTPSMEKDAALQIRLINHNNYKSFSVQSHNENEEKNSKSIIVNYFIDVPCKESCPPKTRNSHRIIAWPCKGNIFFADKYSQRLLPNLPGQSSLQRFCQYLADSCYYKLNEKSN
ncbi:MAG: hypothetical protein ACQETH_04190 [Candidatus Rifleibacteriota bacterium]